MSVKDFKPWQLAWIKECPYCSSETVLTSMANGVFAHRSNSTSMSNPITVWACTNCEAYTTAGGPFSAPHGCLANENLRKLRTKAQTYMSLVNIDKIVNAVRKKYLMPGGTSVSWEMIDEDVCELVLLMAKKEKKYPVSG